MRLRSFRAFTLLLLPGLLLIISQSVYANAVLTIGADPPDCQTRSECGKCASPNNYLLGSSSIGITEGNLRDSYEATRLKSAFGTTIDFSLHYNSYNADNSRAAIDTVMGYGWTHSYNIFLFSQSGHIFRMDGSGRVTKYQSNLDGTFTTAPGYFETLVQTSATTFTITTKNKTVFNFALIPNTPFSVNGTVYRLTSIADRNNNVTSLSYTNGNLTSITDTYSRSLTLVYNNQNKLISVADPLMRATSLEYDSTGTKLMKITDPENKFIQYNYNSLYQLTGKVNKDSNVFSYLYENQKPVAVVDGAGAYLFRLTNSQNWATDANALALNQLRVYVPATTVQMDGRGNLWHYTYDSNGYINRIIALETFHLIGNDKLGFPLSSLWSGDGITTTYIYDPATLMVASTIDAEGRITNNQYDSLGNPTRMTDALGYITTNTYESVFSQMTSMTDPNSRLYTYENDIRGNRTRETDPSGNTQEWSYESHGNVIAAKNKNGNLAQINYNSSGNPMMVIEAVGTPAQRTMTMTHDVVGNELTRTNPNAHTTGYVHDNLNRLTQMIDPTGKITQIFYNGMGNRIQEIDRNGKSVFYEYDGRQRPVKTTDALGQITTRTYDNNNNLTSTTDKNSRRTTYQYNVLNWLSLIADALNNQSTRTYNGVGDMLTETDANGHVTTHEYDQLNRRTKMTDAAGAATLYEYDRVGLSGCAECTGPTLGSNLVTKQTDCSGKIIYYKYNDLDRLILEIHKEGDTADVIDPSDAVTRRTYDANGNLISLTEPNGNTTTFNYNALNHLVKQTNAAGDITTSTFDNVGNIVTRIEPNTNITTNTYDVLNRLIQVDDRIGRVVSYTYDFETNRLSETDGNANTTLYDYDAIYRVVKVTDPLGEITRNQYDPVGNLIKVTDREGHVTTTTYDVINRRTSTTNALGHTTRFVYDPVGNLLKNIDAKSTPGITEYEYDKVNRLIKETYPDAPPNTRTFTYDCVGNLKTSTDQKGQTITYTYNDLYFLLKRDYPVSADDNMTYDLSGRTLSAERGGWLITFNYDGANRVTQSTQNGKTVNYVYNIPGRTRTLTYPGGRSIIEQMDFRNRKTGITDAATPPIVQYSYDLSNRVTSRANRNGTAANYTYNANDWALSLEHSRGATRIAGFGYAYDKQGNKRFEEKRHDLNHSEVYGYDDSYRLINHKVTSLVGFPRPVTQTAYNLDEVGNWTSKVTNRRLTEIRTHNAVNELTSIAGVPLTHDDNGNLIEDQFYRYANDEENRLTSVTRKSDNQLVGQYQYDALGRRVVKVANPFGTLTDTRYLYDGERIIEEQSAVGVTRATYVYGNYIDEALTMDRGGQTYYYHQNALWSVAAVTDSAGNVTERYRYDAYGDVMITDAIGNPLGNVSAIGNPWMFTGRQLDDETGLYFYRARYLDPYKGRFITRDPIGSWGDPNNQGNGYTYVGNNPTTFVDPMGKERKAGESKSDCFVREWTAFCDDFVSCAIQITSPVAVAVGIGIACSLPASIAVSYIPNDFRFHVIRPRNSDPLLNPSITFGGGGGGFNGGGAGGTWLTNSMNTRTSIRGGTSFLCRVSPMSPGCALHICTIAPSAPQCWGRGGFFGGMFSMATSTAAIGNISPISGSSGSRAGLATGTPEQMTSSVLRAPFTIRGDTHASRSIRSSSSYLDPCGPWGTPETCVESLDPRNRGMTW